MMRSVCLVDRLEFEYSGNHYSNAITLGDVDNDQLNELIIGNVDGVLAIFKGDKQNKPWKKCSELGTVTCVGIGDIFNNGSNAVIVLNAERQCHLFLISSTNSVKSPQQVPVRVSSSSSSEGSTSSSVRGGVTSTNTSKTMKPLHSLTLDRPNAKALSVSKLAPDGNYCLYVANTDRSVVVYRWNEETKHLDMLNRFSLHGQIGCLSESVLKDGSVQLLVSQPGGTYVTLYCRERSPFEEGPGNNVDLSLGSVVGQAQRRSPTSSTELVGSIRAHLVAASGDGDQTATPRTRDIVALCTLDGVVRLLKDKEKQWELQVDHSLFAIGKLDVTGDGSDEIVVCAWDGTTYIVDQNRNCVRFHFEQNVSGFCCGYYGLSDGGNQPCLVYTTFSNMIYLYHNVTLPSIPSSNLLLTLQNKNSVPSLMQDQLLLMDSKEKQELFSQCLYSFEHQNETPAPATNSHKHSPTQL